MKRTLVFIVLLSQFFIVAYAKAPVDPVAFKRTERGFIEMAPEKYHSILRSIRFRFDIPEELLYAVPMIESSWEEDAVSPANCQGLMQLNPKYEEWFIEEFWGYTNVDFDISNPKHNLYVGFAYLAWLYKQVGSWDLALYAYNSGLTTVNNHLNTGKSLPLESINYIVKAEKLGVIFN
ncbi:MAG: lytic transglycosylase domain-containing protein [Candidatus Woesearchaeota archaeon]|jgi:soluble lytic murein transglycosylase-like protein|nr:lytic transglycosylase domain-containing protein [Candidatus Woesearchaeota archaeon]